MTASGLKSPFRRGHPWLINVFIVAYETHRGAGGKTSDVWVELLITSLFHAS